MYSVQLTTGTVSFTAAHAVPKTCTSIKILTVLPTMQFIFVAQCTAAEARTRINRLIATNFQSNDISNSPQWLGSRVVSMLDSGAEGPEFKLQLRCCRLTVSRKLFTPIVPLFTKQQNW